MDNKEMASHDSSTLNVEQNMDKSWTSQIKQFKTSLVDNFRKDSNFYLLEAAYI